MFKINYTDNVLMVYVYFTDLFLHIQREKQTLTVVAHRVPIEAEDADNEDSMPVS